MIGIPNLNDIIFNVTDIRLIIVIICIGCSVIIFFTFIGFGFKLRSIKNSLKELVKILKDHENKSELIQSILCPNPTYKYQNSNQPMQNITQPIQNPNQPIQNPIQQNQY